MKISRELANRRLAEFLEKAVLPNLKGGKKDNLTRFKIGVSLTMGWVKVTDEQYEDMVAAGVADKDGIDLDVLRKAVDGGVTAAGGEVHVEKLGLWLSTDDVARLFAYLETGTLP